jgi:methionyl-tRNA formyltransferase
MSFSFVFYGTPEFAVRVLDRLESKSFRPAAVVCQPDSRKGRGRKLTVPPVKAWALEREVEVWQPVGQNERDYIENLHALGPDVCLVAAFGQIFPGKVLGIPRLGFINVHPSLIPRYRGAAPIQWAMINGDETTGTTILKVTPRLDQGEVLLQEKITVDLNETAAVLRQRLATLGGDLAAQVLFRFSGGNTAGTAQDESQVVWAPALEKQDGLIHWDLPALTIHNRIRGMQPWPGAITRLGKQVLKIHRARLVDIESEAEPGVVILARGNKFFVQTGQGVLGLLEVQAEGRQRLDASAFLSGSKILPGTLLEF